MMRTIVRRESSERRSQLVEKISKFLDEDHRESIKTIRIQFRVGVAIVHNQP